MQQYRKHPLRRQVALPVTGRLGVHGSKQENRRRWWHRRQHQRHVCGRRVRTRPAVQKRWQQPSRDKRTLRRHTRLVQTQAAPAQRGSSDRSLPASVVQAVQEPTGAAALPIA